MLDSKILEMRTSFSETWDSGFKKNSRYMADIWPISKLFPQLSIGHSRLVEDWFGLSTCNLYSFTGIAFSTQADTSRSRDLFRHVPQFLKHRDSSFLFDFDHSQHVNLPGS